MSETTRGRIRLLVALSGYTSAVAGGTVVFNYAVGHSEGYCTTGQLSSISLKVGMYHISDKWRNRHK